VRIRSTPFGAALPQVLSLAPLVVQGWGRAHGRVRLFMDIPSILCTEEAHAS
jgi:hypothetical protein